MGGIRTREVNLRVTSISSSKIISKLNNYHNKLLNKNNNSYKAVLEMKINRERIWIVKEERAVREGELLEEEGSSQIRLHQSRKRNLLREWGQVGDK